jgi:hypothetical protein
MKQCQSIVFFLTLNTKFMKTLIAFAFSWVMFIQFAPNLHAFNDPGNTLGELVKTSELTDMKLYFYSRNGDQHRLFLFFRGQGYIESGSMNLIMGGKAPDSIYCVAVLDYDIDFNLINEEILGVNLPRTGKHTSIRSLKKKKTIAFGDKCLGQNWEEELVNLYPELNQRNQQKKSTPPKKVFYNNYIKYKLLGEVDKFRINVYTYKESDDASPKRGVLSWLLEENKSNYNLAGEDIELRPYKGSDKEAYWARQFNPVCDFNTGITYAWHYKQFKKINEYKSRELNNEFVVFDKEGNVINCTEINFDIHHELNFRGINRWRNSANELVIGSFAHVYKQAHGFGYKKTNPNPDKLLRHLYHWDNQGNLINRKDFHVNDEDTKIIAAFNNNDRQLSLFGTDNKLLYQLVSTENNLSEFQPLPIDSPIFSDHFINNKDLNSNWNDRFIFKTPENKSVFVHELYHQYLDFKTRDSVHVRAGIVATVFDPNRNLEKLYSFPSPENRNGKRTTPIEILKEEGNHMIMAIHFPININQYQTEIYAIDWSTHQKIQLGVIESANYPTIIFNKENEQVLAISKQIKTGLTLFYGF